MHSPLEVMDDDTFHFLQPFGQFHDVSIYGREKLTLNTGWVKEEWNEVVKQMMLTQYLYDPDTLMPFTQQTANTQFKTSLNDGLINYTFVFKKAFNSINTVS